MLQHRLFGTFASERVLIIRVIKRTYLTVMSIRVIKSWRIKWERDVYIGFRLVNMKERSHLEDLCIYGLMKYIFWGVEWTDIVRTGTSGGALNMAMKLRIPENAGKFLNNWKTISSARRTLVLIYWLFLYLEPIFENTVELKVHEHKKMECLKGNIVMLCEGTTQ